MQLGFSQTSVHLGLGQLSGFAHFQSQTGSLQDGEQLGAGAL